MNIPAHLKSLLVKVITVLLAKINTPQEEIDTLVEKIDERGVSAMLTLENYDVQETRRQAKEEERQRADKAEFHLKSVAKSLLGKGNTVMEVAAMMSMSESDIAELLPELA